MSVVIETFILCDHCNENFGVDFRSYTAEKHRRDAKSEGWKQIGSNDYCPECVAKIKNKTS